MRDDLVAANRHAGRQRSGGAFVSDASGLVRRRSRRQTGGIGQRPSRATLLPSRGADL